MMWNIVEVTGGGTSDKAGPCGRAKHSATLLGGYVYVVGGRGQGGTLPLKDFWRYNLSEGTWERVLSAGEAPPALQEHSAVGRDAVLYVFGGEPAPQADVPLWTYNTQKSSWRKLSTPARGDIAPCGRRGHSAAVYKDRMLIYGGYQDLRGSTDELWAFHFESEKWELLGGGKKRTASWGPARHRHAGVLHRATLYVHAGSKHLRDCADLWTLDLECGKWQCVRWPPKLCPAPRSGHAALRAGAHLYVFGGDVQGQLVNDLWRMHFGTETWERIEGGVSWPSPRVDARALLVPSPPRSGPVPPPAPSGPGPAPARPRWSLARGGSKRLSRGEYTALDTDAGDSLEELPTRTNGGVVKSHSAYIIDNRLVDPEEPREADEAESGLTVSRSRTSVPDLADSDLADLLYDRQSKPRPLPASASVRFARDVITIVTDDDSTSDYASAEKVSGFCNPNYVGPGGGVNVAMTPDSGAGDIEMRELGPVRGKVHPTPRLHVLLVGGKERARAPHQQGPISMWTYRLL